MLPSIDPALSSPPHAPVAVTTHHILPPQSSTDLRAIDLSAPSAPSAPRGGDGRVDTVEPAPPPVYSHPKVFVPAATPPGGTVRVEEDGSAVWVGGVRLERKSESASPVSERAGQSTDGASPNARP